MTTARRGVKVRRRDRQRSADAADEMVKQIEWSTCCNRYPALEPLTEDHLEAVHESSMRVLEELGVEVAGERALELFRRAGADVGADGLVRLDRGLVAEALADVPSRFTLTPRNPERAIEIGGNRIHFGMVSGPPNVHDGLAGRRPGNFADFEKLTRLGQSFNCIGFFGNQTLAPIDLPPNNRHLDTYRAILMLSDKVFSAIPIGAGRVRDAVQMVALARGQTLEQLAAAPACFGNININSPRKLDEAMAEGAMQLSELGQAVIVTPFTLLGAMAPVTLGAALAQQNAEALLGVVLTQLVRPGAPVVYGGFTSNVDMRSGAPAFGTPENARANLAGGQLARRYGLPYRSSACNASNAVDVQAVYETQMAMWGAVMGHANLVYHAAGWLEGGLVASFEKVVVDVELIQNLRLLLEPVVTAEDDFTGISEVAPGGHFFGAPHTMSRYQSAFYEPLLSDWRNSETWQQSGAFDATTRATGIWQQVLRSFDPPALDPARREALDAYVAQRKTEIGSDDP